MYCCRLSVLKELMNEADIEKIEKYYGNKGNITKAIDNISFKVGEG